MLFEHHSFFPFLSICFLSSQVYEVGPSDLKKKEKKINTAYETTIFYFTPLPPPPKNPI